MKKRYVAPTAETVTIEMVELMAASPNVTMQIDAGAEGATTMESKQSTFDLWDEG